MELMGVISMRPPPEQGDPTRLRQKERQRTLQQLPGDGQQAQAQNPIIQSDVYPKAGEADAAQLQASVSKLPNHIAPHLRQVSFIPPARLRGRRSTAGVTGLIQEQKTIYSDTLRTIESTKREIRAIEGPIHPTQVKAARRQAVIQARRQADIQAGSRLMEAQRKADETDLPSPVTLQSPNKPWSLGGTRQRVSDIYSTEKEKQKEKGKSRKHEPARAYQFGSTIIVEDEDGEVVKTYEIPSQEQKTAVQMQAEMEAKDLVAQTLAAQNPIAEFGVKEFNEQKTDQLKLDNQATEMHTGGSSIDRVDRRRRYRSRPKGRQQEPQKQWAKEFSVVPTISKDYTAGEKALRADLLAKLGRGEKRLLSTMRTHREKEFSVVPTISKDHTAGEQALQADLPAKLGRKKKRHLSTTHTSRSSELSRYLNEPPELQQVLMTVVAGSTSENKGGLHN